MVASVTGNFLIYLIFIRLLGVNVVIEKKTKKKLEQHAQQQQRQ